jgi:hypothetical protein
LASDCNGLAADGRPPKAGLDRGEGENMGLSSNSLVVIHMNKKTKYKICVKASPVLLHAEIQYIRKNALVFLV